MRKEGGHAGKRVRREGRGGGGKGRRTNGELGSEGEAAAAKEKLGPAAGPQCSPPTHPEASPLEVGWSRGGKGPAASEKFHLNVSCELNCPAHVSRKPRRLTRLEASSLEVRPQEVATRKPEERVLKPGRRP